MIANQLYEAAARVGRIQQSLIDRQRFRGFSGKARAISGTMALAASALMALPQFPKQPGAHLFVWGAVFVIGFMINYGALLNWFLFDSSSNRELRRLRPAIDTLPPLIVGGILTLAAIQNQQFDLLFGVWMCLFGLACMVSRANMPRLNWYLGALYIAAGLSYLLSPEKSFLNPWPMGIVFFFGEWTGGLLFHFDQKPNLTIEPTRKDDQSSGKGKYVKR